MRPKKPQMRSEGDLFRARLDQIINMKHELVQLAGAIDWEWLDAEVAPLFSDKGRPASPARFMIGLLLLKHIFTLSDEQVCERWVYDPYFQYFTGEEFFQHAFPHERSDLSHWRGRLGVKLELLLAETLRIAHAAGALRTKDLARVTVDTTVQPKAITFPTDAKLLHAAIKGLNRLAKKHGVRLRQSYLRLANRAAMMAGRYAHAKQFKRHHRQLRFLRARLGRLIRDIGRKIVGQPQLEAVFQWPLTRARQIRSQQQRQRGWKLYSFHAPEVECIGKGKARAPYELMAWTTPALSGNVELATGAQAMANTNIATIGIDLGKNTFHVVGLDTAGAIVLRKRRSRNQLEPSLANVRPCLIGMEACAGAHHLGRKLEKLGHQVRLLPAQYVKPYLKGHKNDFRDAEAIAEAVQRPTMRFVPLKSAEQLDLQALHRVRSRLVTERTAVINQIRGFLLERGLPVRQGAAALRLALPQILSMLSDNLVRLVQDLAEDWRYLDRRIVSITKEIGELADQDAHCRRLMAAPGVGPIISSAMVAAIGTGDAFHKGRDFAAWLGLVPKQISTGDRTILGRISRRGNRYLRTLFIQGARAVLLQHKSWPRHGFGAWLEAASKRLHSNVLVVALAAKLARMAWSMLAKGRDYDPKFFGRTA